MHTKTPTEQRLAAHVESARKVEQLENRLYGIDGQIYELESRGGSPSDLRRLENLKEQQAQAEQRKAELSRMVAEEDARILVLLPRIHSKRRAKLLRLLFVERLSYKEAACRMYPAAVQDGIADARTINKLFTMRRRAIAELAQLEQQEGQDSEP